MIRSLKGHYAKRELEEGIDYVMYRTKALAQANVKWYFPDGGYVVKVRATITPIDSARTERMVAVRQTRPTAYAETNKVRDNFYP
jgi:hypothetical protein